MSLEQAVTEVVQRKLKAMRAEGGVIAIDSDGRIAMSFNTEGMFRGARDSGGRREIAIY
jgi:beta-aspartyl-peptidase (threonine type)